MKNATNLSTTRMTYYTVSDYKYWFVGKVKTYLLPTIKLLFIAIFETIVQCLRFLIFPIWAIVELLFCLYTVMVRRLGK